MDLYFLDHLCFFWILGIINNHIKERSLYFENRPAIILKAYKNLKSDIKIQNTMFLKKFGLQSETDNHYNK